MRHHITEDCKSLIIILESELDKKFEIPEPINDNVSNDLAWTEAHRKRMCKCKSLFMAKIIFPSVVGQCNVK